MNRMKLILVLVLILCASVAWAEDDTGDTDGWWQKTKDFFNTHCVFSDDYAGTGPLDMFWLVGNLNGG